jgi:putative membrane protein
MIQHMLLVFAMPPLLLYGTPGWMLRPLLRDPKLLQLGRALTRPTGAFATFNLILIAWHLPPLYNLAMEQHPFHILGHLLMMAGSVILWWPVLSPLDELPRAPYPIQMLYLFVVGLPMVMVAIFISMADGLLYPYYAGAPRIWAQLTPRPTSTGRAHHVDPRGHGLPAPLRRLLPLAGRGRRRRRGAPQPDRDPCRLRSPSPRWPRSSCS